LTASYTGNDLIIAIAKNTTMTDVSATAGATTAALDITTSDAAKTSITALDAAIKTLNSQRASLGSISNRLDSTVSNLTNISSNLQAGRGRIEDADFAAETTSLAKSQILQQASTAMLAQANASKQNVLSLLQG
jgi:flagellin